MPGHGDLTALRTSRIALSWTFWVVTIQVQLEVKHFVRIAVAWRTFCPTRRVVCNKTRKNIGELRILYPISEIKRDFTFVFGVA